MDFAEVQDTAGPEITPWENDFERAETAVAMQVSPLNLPVAKARFKDFAQLVERIRADAQAVEISSDESLKFAVALGGESKRIARSIDTRRKEIINDPGEFVKAVNGFCKVLTDPLAEAETAVKGKISMYQHQIEMERRKAEEAARKAAAELQEKLRREAQEANMKAREEAIRQAEEALKAQRAKEEAERAARHEAESKIQEEGRKIREAEEMEAARVKAASEAKAAEISAPTVLQPVIPKAENVTRTETGAAAFQRKTWEFELTDIAQVPRDYLILDEKRVRDAIRMGIRDLPGIRIFETSKTVLR